MKLIKDTSLINASYSLATGLAQMNILLTMPLNVADIVVLTKNQALMAYRLALSGGLSSDWRQTIPKLATVVSTAFLWRLIARQSIGLLPVVGVAPKVAVSYAGTYAIGQAIYQWSINGIIVYSDSLKSAYNQALRQGRDIAHSLFVKQRGRPKLLGVPKNRG